MKLPEEIRNLSKSADFPFQSKWEWGLPRDWVSNYYESRYKGRAIRYEEGRWVGDWDNSRNIRHRLKLFHSRPLNLGLQCYFNVSQMSPHDLRRGEDRNVFASKLRTTCSDVKCYAAEKGLAELLFSQGKIIEALVELQDVTRKLRSGGFVLVDEGLVILTYEASDESVLDAMHNLSTALTESTLVLPAQRKYRTLNLGPLLGLVAFLLAIILLIILTGGDFGWLFS